MSAIINGIRYLYTEENMDPRTKGFFLASHPYQIFTIVGIYLFFTLYAGPKFMKHRKPFKLKKLLIVYNFLQIMMSVYLTVGGFIAIRGQTYFNYFCQPIDHEDTPVTQFVHRMAWCYYFAKITELLDTVFFIMRKKYNQVTLLHVYHHASMAFFSYVGFRHFPNGHGTVFGLLNSFIHIIMYSYYLIAALGSQYQKYLWWKKHITTLQLIQFVIIFFHNFPNIFGGCGFPRIIHVLYTIDSVLFFYLFGKFYVKSYFGTKKNRKVKETSNEHSIQQTNKEEKSS